MKFRWHWKDCRICGETFGQLVAYETSGPLWFIRNRCRVCNAR